MACESCLLERPGAEAIPLEDFLDELLVCEDCPLMEGSTMIPAVRLLVQRHRESARVLRRTSNELRKQRREQAEIAEAMARHEARMSALESVHRRAAEESERELREKLRFIEGQSQALLELSAPILYVDDGVVAVPIIGTMDDERAAVLREGLLGAIAQGGVRHAIIDLTGVDSMDTDFSHHLMAIVRAARLLGVAVLLSGVRSALARSIVSLGINTAGVLTVRDLKQAISLCRRNRVTG